MKFNKFLQLIAIAACALPAAFSLNSCTEEDLVDNYKVVLGDSTYFTYDIEPFKPLMQTDSLIIYSFEITSPRKNDCKWLAYSKKYGYWYFFRNKETDTNIKSDHWAPVIDWENEDFTDEDKVVEEKSQFGTYIKEGLVQKKDGEYRFYFGAGDFLTVLIPEKNNAVDMDSLRSTLKYPSVVALDTLKVNYIINDEPVAASPGNIWENAIFPLDNWSDKNVYTNANGSKAGFVALSQSQMFGGVTDIVPLKIGEHKNIEFTQNLFTKDYDIELTLTKDDDAVNFPIEEVFVSLAGLPSNVKFKNNELDVENTSKVSFKLFPQDENNAGKQEVVCKRTINVMGITYGTDSLDFATVNGPGVAQITIKSTYNGGTELIALCNIKKSIQEAEVVEATENGWFKTENTKLPIKISTKITADMLKNSNYYRNPKVMIWKD